MSTTETEYNKQANEFLTKTGTEYKAEFLKFDKHFEDDKEERLIFKITLTRGTRKYSFNFGASLNDTEKAFKMLHGKTLYGDDWRGNLQYPAKRLRDEEVLRALIPLITKHKDKIKLPSAYSVLACLTKYNPYDFNDFCMQYGYDNDSKKAEKTYNAVKEEWQNVQALWSDKEIEQLQDIQ